MRKYRHYIRMAFFSAIACVAVWSISAGHAQGTAANPSSAKNWRDIPVPLHVHPDTTNASERQARNEYWAKRFPMPDSSKYIPQGALYDSRMPEIRHVPGSFWALGTFAGYDLYEVPNSGVYTEIHFHLEQIVGPKTGTTPQAGTMIDVAFKGGTVLTSSGEVRKVPGGLLRFADAPRPGRRYLLQLVPERKGNFYLPADYWDITDGKVAAVTPLDRLTVSDGHSHLAGLSAADAVNYIQNALSDK